MKFSLALLIAAIACTGSAAHADLIQNGGFDTGSYAPWTSVAVTETQDGLSAYDGQYYALFGGGIAGLMTSQAISDTAGQQLTLTFYVASVNITDSMGSFSTYWNGIQIAPTVYSFQSFSWTKYSYTVTSTGSDHLTFLFNPNDESPAIFGLDDVSLNPPQAIPEPGTFELLGAGLAGLGALRRRRKVSKAA